MECLSERAISFSLPDISELEIQEVCDAMRSGWITTGMRTKKLERKLAEFIGMPAVNDRTRPNMVCLNSATAAEELNLRVLGIGSGDEVIVPAYTYTSTAAAVIHTGAAVKFIDSQPGCCEMNYEKLEAAITERTKAVIPVDIGGVVCNYESIFKAVENKKCLFHPANKIQEAMGRIAVVADCAHALGSRWHEIMAGSIADFSSFSFHAVKNLTTAEGGASCWKHIEGIDDTEIYGMYQLMSLHGQSKDALSKTKAGEWEYDIAAPFYKYNMTDITAAIGLKQLERYPKMLQRRKEIIEKYDDFCDDSGILHLIHYGENFSSSGHLYMTRVAGIGHEERCEVITKMAERGVACNVHYKPLPMMTAYKKLGFDIANYPNAYEYFKNEITLPLHTKLSDDDIGYVCENFKAVLNGICKRNT